MGTGVSEGDVTGPLACAGRNQLLPLLGGPGRGYVGIRAGWQVLLGLAGD